jgi:hemerythrin-like domain-containing protein
MKIIDKNTGKRVGADPDQKVINKKLKEEDPILRNAEKDGDMEELSPMDPPDAYDKSRVLGSDYDSMPIFLQELMDDHKEVITYLEKFDQALIAFKENGFHITETINEAFNEFFTYFDEHLLPHNRKEERHYFRMLHDKLIESGEHGEGDNPYTAVDLMEDDHTKFIQLGALCFNLLGLGTRLDDAKSKALTFDLAFNNGRELTELLRLHVFREDETLFPLSQKLMSSNEFDAIYGK